MLNAVVSNYNKKIILSNIRNYVFAILLCSVFAESYIIANPSLYDNVFGYSISNVEIAFLIVVAVPIVILLFLNIQFSLILFPIASIFSFLSRSELSPVDADELILIFIFGGYLLRIAFVKHIKLSLARKVIVAYFVFAVIYHLSMIGYFFDTVNVSPLYVSVRMLARGGLIWIMVSCIDTEKSFRRLIHSTYYIFPIILSLLVLGLILFNGDIFVLRDSYLRSTGVSENSFTLLLQSTILSNRNITAYTLLLVLPLLFVDAIRLESLQRFYWYKCSAVALVCVATVLTFSRGGWVAFVVSAGAMTYMNRDSGAIKLAVRYLPIFLLIFGIVLGPVVFGNFQRLTDENRNTIVKRVTIYRTAVDLFISNPLLGIGPFNPAEYMAQSENVRKVSSFRQGRIAIHNIYLTVLTENGVLGFMAFVNLIVSYYLYLRRLELRVRERYYKNVITSVKAALIVMLILGMRAESLWYDPLWFLLGLPFIIDRLTINKYTSDMKFD